MPELSAREQFWLLQRQCAYPAEPEKKNWYSNFQSFNGSTGQALDAGENHLHRLHSGGRRFDETQTLTGACRCSGLRAPASQSNNPARRRRRRPATIVQSCILLTASPKHCAVASPLDLLDVQFGSIACGAVRTADSPRCRPGADLTDNVARHRAMVMLMRLFGTVAASSAANTMPARC